MRLVDNHTRIPRQIRFRQKLPQQHTIRHILDRRLIARAILEPNRVPHFLSDPTPYFLRYTSRHGHRRHSTRLSASDLLAVFAVARFVEVLRELGRFARTGFAFDNEDLVLRYGVEELFPPGVDGEGLADFVDGLGW